MFVPVTSLYAALFALMLIPITIRVGLRRVTLKVFSGDGGDEVLNRRMRAHGNFVEYVPFGLLLIALMESNGAPQAYVHGLGALFLAARVMHYFTLITNPLAITRAISMLGTTAVFLLSALWLLFKGLANGV